MRVVAAFLFVVFYAGSATGQTESPELSAAEAQPEAPLTEILVTGEQPGPGLWKISKGDHVMWLLGAHAPLPKKMTWRSKHVEALIAESQEVLAPVKVDVDTNIGFFRAVTLLPSLLGAAKNPDDALLKDIVPPEVYAKWLVLKQKYIGRDQGVEKWRPTFAAQELRSEAMEKLGLDNSSIVWPAVSKVAKRHKVKIVEPQVEVKVTIEQPRAMLKKFRRTELPDIECFAKSLDRLEGDLEAMKARANAWSVGDIESLRRLTTDQSDDCLQLLQKAMLSGQLADELGAQQTVENVKREADRARKDAEQKWLAAAQSALSRNTVTFAVLSIREILLPEGYVEKLRGLGYSIEEP